MALNLTLLAVELVVLTGLLLWTHHRSRTRGLGAMLMLLAALLAVLQTFGAIPALITAGPFVFVATSAVLVPVLLSGLLVLYVAEGTESARHTIVAIVVLSVLVLGWQYLRDAHIALPGGSTLPGAGIDGYLRSWRLPVASVIAFSASLGTIAIVYQALTNIGRAPTRLVAPAIALLGALVVDDLVFTLVGFGWEALLDRFPWGLPSKLLGGVMVAPLVTAYLSRWSPHLDRGEDDRRPVFDLVMGDSRNRDELLQETELRFRHTLDSTPIGLAHTDDEGTILLANRSLAELLDVPEDAIRGRTLDSFVVQDERDRWRSVFRPLLAGEKDAVTLELPLLRGEDSPVWVRITASPVRGVARRRWFVATVEDLTERRAEAARQAQASRMEAMGQMTGGVAHDFNNLLTVVLGGIETVLYDLPEEQRAPLNDALDAAERGAMLSSKLLAFSRRQTLLPRVLDIGRLISDLEEILRRSLPESLDLAVEIPAEPVHCEIDGGLLETTLLNLVVNARDASADGGRIRVILDRLDEMPRTGRGVVDGPCARIRVVDRGTGIAEEIRERILEPFFTTKEVGSGTGLGLSMAVGFVEQSGGVLDIESEVGRGTTVCLCLPLVETGESAAETLVPEATHPRGSWEHVLVLEDDPAVRALTERALTRLGYVVQSATDGADALEYLTNNRDSVDLLLTDVVIPGGMNGVQVAEAARRLRPDLPVVLMSGYLADTLETIPKELRRHVLQKPFRTGKLASYVAAALRATKSKSVGA